MVRVVLFEGSEVKTKESCGVVVVVVFEMAASSSEKQVVVIGIDDSEQSTYALNWALDNFFPSPIFKLVLIHSRPTATSAVGFAGPGRFILLRSSFSRFLR